MNQVTVTDTTVATAPVAVAPKAPSKKSLALAIFAGKLTERSQGLFASNKEFRAAVLTAIQIELGVSVASAATMFNAAKVEAEKANPAIGLGRDPKKVKAPSTGKRGRPAKVAPVAEAVAPAATETVATEATATAEAVA